MKKINSGWLMLIVAGLLLLTVLSVIFVLSPWQVRGAEATASDETENAESDASVSAQTSRKGRMTILLAGTDRTSGLSDVLMLVSLDRDTGETRILQLPRDTYVKCGSGSYRKLNGAPSALGGMEEFRTFMAKISIITHIGICMHVVLTGLL